MQPYSPKAPSRSEALIDELRRTAGELVNGTVEDGAVPIALLAGAADEIERLRNQEFRLARRIHQQRIALRDNWEIIEMRASHRRAWVRSPLLRDMLKRGATRRGWRDALRSPMFWRAFWEAASLQTLWWRPR